MKRGLGVSSVGTSSVWAFCFVLQVRSLFIRWFILSALLYHSFPTSIFKVHRCSLCFCRLQCATLSPGQEWKQQLPCAVEQVGLDPARRQRHFLL